MSWPASPEADPTRPGARQRPTTRNWRVLEQQTTAATDINGATAHIDSRKPHCRLLVHRHGATKKTVTLAQGETLEWNPVMASAAEALLVVVSAGRFEQDASEVTVSLEVLQPALVENKATTSLKRPLSRPLG